jgi:hypothetical protein
MKPKFGGDAVGSVARRDSSSCSLSADGAGAVAGSAAPVFATASDGGAVGFGSCAASPARALATGTSRLAANAATTIPRRR